jgi:hypothetical protein
MKHEKAEKAKTMMIGLAQTPFSPPPLQHHRHHPPPHFHTYAQKVCFLMSVCARMAYFLSFFVFF